MASCADCQQELPAVCAVAPAMAHSDEESDEAPDWQRAYLAETPWFTPHGCVQLTGARLRSFWRRIGLQEFSGSLGDLGTLIPLLAACAQRGSIRLGPAVFWMGIFNIVSAFQWDIPMPVQPMKSIAAVAISDGMEPGAFAAAGILTGGIVWLLGVTRTIELFNALIPQSVIAGMQVGLGTKMAATGCGYWVVNQWDVVDGKLTALLCLMLSLFLILQTKLPTALIIFLIGLGLTVHQMVRDGVAFEFAFLRFSTTLPEGREWLEGFVKGAVPQLPLTTLNSVVSVCALSVDLFGDPSDGGKGVSRVSVASSVGIMNVAACWFGAMPSCHGAGGLAGQYKFGARGGCAVLVLGIVKVLLSLHLGSTLDSIIAYYPKVILGVLLLFAGVELASIGTKALLKAGNLETALLPCFVTVGAYIGTKNMALGVAAGLLAELMQSLHRWRSLRERPCRDAAEPLPAQCGRSAVGTTMPEAEEEPKFTDIATAPDWTP